MIRRVGFTYFILVFLLAGGFGTVPLAHALPEGGQVIGGEAAIHQSGPGQLDIHQTTDRALIEWNQFNIDPNELVRFVQPGSESVALNRITGLDPSSILGALSANGRVFLINPNGILFGANATVDVSGLLATTMDINNADFMAGNDLFTGTGGSIINRGQIRVADNGFVFLVAPGVKNEGLIVAHLGRVVLGSGERMTIDFMGDGLLQYAIDGKVLDQVTSPDGTPLAAGVDNQGTIMADGGEVVLTARASSDILGTVVNQTGVIRANSLTNRGGVIRLEASDPIAGEVEIGRQANLGRVENAGGAVIHSGLLDVSAKEAGAAKGVVILSGERVGVSGDIHAEGGSVLVTSTNKTIVTGSSAINTSGVEAGSAGNVVIWSDDTTLFNGAILARGGDVGGNAGQVEVSGYQNLGFDGTVDLAAPQGNGGTLLLDPKSITITTGGGSGTQNEELKDTPCCEVNFLDGNIETTTVTVNEDAIQGIAPGSNIVLEASDFILMNNLADDKLELSLNSSLTLRTQTGKISGTTLDAIVTSGTGAITIDQGSGNGDGKGIVDWGRLQTGGGAINITADGNVHVRLINAGSGTVSITSLFGSLIDGSSTVFLTADTANLTAAGKIGDSSDDYDIQVNHLTLSAGGSFDVDNNSVLKTLNITSTQAGKANTYILKDQGFTPSSSFNITDTGTEYLIKNVISPGLNFSFSGDETVAVDNINVGVGTASVTSRLGSIVENGSEGGADITARSVTLVAPAGSIGRSAGEILEVGTAHLTLDIGTHLNLASTIDLATLSMSSTQVGESNTYILTAPGLDPNFKIVDVGASYQISNVTDDTGLVFSFKGDSPIEVEAITVPFSLITTDEDITVKGADLMLGSINAGTGNVTLTAEGAIFDDIDDSVADITGASVSLTAKTGIGTKNGNIDLSAATVSQVQTKTGGINLQNLIPSSFTNVKTTDVGNIHLSGKGATTFTRISSVDGNIALSVDGGLLRASLITAGKNGGVSLVTTTSGDIFLKDVVAGQVQINSVGKVINTDIPSLDVLVPDPALRNAIDMGAKDIPSFDQSNLNMGGDTFIQVAAIPTPGKRQKTDKVAASLETDFIGEGLIDEEDAQTTPSTEEAAPSDLAETQDGVAQEEGEVKAPPVRDIENDEGLGIEAETSRSTPSQKEDGMGEVEDLGQKERLSPSPQKQNGHSKNNGQTSPKGQSTPAGTKEEEAPSEMEGEIDTVEEESIAPDDGKKPTSSCGEGQKRVNGKCVGR
jgi:filamentous hemagglutinin family protein